MKTSVSNGKIFVFALLIIWNLCSAPTSEGRRTTEEFLQEAGFSQSTGSEWKNSAGAVVLMEGDDVKGFTAPQTHGWKIVFGDGSVLGKTVQVKKGDVVTFADSLISLGSKGPYFKLNSAFVTRGILKSAIFNPQRETLSCTDIKQVRGSEESMGWFATTNNPESYQALDNTGNLVTLVLAKRKKDAEERNRINANYERAKSGKADENYQAYCQKYGNAKIDALVNGDIVEGVPWDLTAKMIQKLSLYVAEVISDSQSFTVYKVRPVLLPVNDWYEWYKVYVDKDTGLVYSFYKKYSYNRR